MINEKTIEKIDFIQNELKFLKEELMKDSKNNNEYCVYYHLLPNNKYYIGKSKRTKQRWLNGEGYKANKEFYSDIKKYGWDNIKHIILFSTDQEECADSIEKKLIFIYEADKYGYNKFNWLKEIPIEEIRTDVDKWKKEFEKQGIDLLELENIYKTHKEDDL